MSNFLIDYISVFPDSLAIVIFAVIVLFIVNICYKYLMDQDKAKRYRSEIKEMNKKMKEMRKKKEKTDKLMKEVMKKNNDLMMMSMKPMLASMIIVVLILPGLAGVYGNQTIANNATNITIDNTVYEITHEGKNIYIGDIQCELPCNEKIIGDSIWNIKEKENNVEFERVVALIPISLPIIGNDLGWLGWYIFVSIPVMFVIKKILKVNI